MTMLDLDALVSRDRLPVVRLFGREMPVFPLTGAAAHKIAVVQEQDTTGAGMLGALLDVVAVCVPELTADERAALTVDQITALMQLSRGGIADVEAMLTERAAKN
jgi:hypothetical protein